MTLDPDPECIFCKIVGGQIGASIVLRTELVTAFRDISPQMPVHVLVVPNRHIANTEALEAEHDGLVGAMVRAARDVAGAEGLGARGYRLVFNTGPDANNSVPHLHLHLLGGRPMSWPPG
ncbi:MAG: histidine triad nucleotide-binding protein [Chloroflexota bacterium]